MNVWERITGVVTRPYKKLLRKLRATVLAVRYAWYMALSRHWVKAQDFNRAAYYKKVADDVLLQFINADRELRTK